jgi:Flp pilus assembly protein TadG
LKPGPALTETTLKTKICDQLDIIVSPTTCLEELEVDLQSYTTFEAASAVRVKLTAGDRYTRDLDTTGFKVEPGLSQSKNMLRVFYRWPVITDFMSKLVSNIQGGKTLHIATATWQNEPFDD